MAFSCIVPRQTGFPNQHHDLLVRFLISNRHIITGTSGTGKTTLINELSRRGFTVFHEPTRRVLEEQLTIDVPVI